MLDAPAPTRTQSTLAAVEVAYCDSLEALESAYARGLPRDARIRTLSPALLISGAQHIEHAESRIARSTFEQLHGSLNDFSRALRDALERRPKTAAYGLTAAHAGVAVNRLILRAACLEEEDFRAPRAVIQVDVGDEPLNRIFNGDWARLVGSAQDLNVITVRIAPTAERSRIGEDRASLAARLALAGVDRIGYRALLALWRILPRRLARSEVLIASENELVKETALHLGIRGFALRGMTARPGEGSPPAAELAATLRALLEPVIRRRLRPHLVRPAEDRVAELFFDGLFEAIGRQNTWAEVWREELDGAAAGRRRIVLANFPNATVFVPLRPIAREHGVAVAGFQHGVDRELARAQDQFEVTYENVFSDILFTYNRAAEAVARRNSFARGCRRVVTVGMPKDFFRIRRAKADRHAPPILYVSTLLYRGHFQNRLEEVSDLEKARDEIDLIENVFARLPHRVAYKPYPALRFPDPDAVISAARRASNVEIVGTHMDLRYMLGRHRVLVSTRATSTIGWCVMSQRPFVFIDTGDYFTIRPDVRDVFTAGTFFFDAAQGGWIQDLRAFLSQPVEEIEAQWRDMAAGRKALIEECFSVPEPGAGRRAAGVIAGYLRRETTES